MKKMKRLLATLVVISFLFTGCIGSFVAFNKLRVWNQNVTDEKWVNEVVFLGLTFFFVYGLVSLADVIIFNSIEFWTGENPMANVKFSKKGDKKAVQKFSSDENGKSTQVLYYEKEELQHTLSLHQATGSSTLTGHVAWTDGRTEDFTVQDRDDGIRVIQNDSTGKITSKLYAGDALEQIRLKVARIMGGQRLAMQ
jgi:hypothetical protein